MAGCRQAKVLDLSWLQRGQPTTTTVAGHEESWTEEEPTASFIGTQPRIIRCMESVRLAAAVGPRKFNKRLEDDEMMTSGPVHAVDRP